MDEHCWYDLLCHSNHSPWSERALHHCTKSQHRYLSVVNATGKKSHTHTHTHTFIHTLSHTYAYTYICTHTYIYKQTHEHTQTHTTHTSCHVCAFREHFILRITNIERFTKFLRCKYYFPVHCIYISIKNFKLFSGIRSSTHCHDNTQYLPFEQGSIVEPLSEELASDGLWTVGKLRGLE